MGYGMWQGLEKATGTLANTGMRLLEYDQARKQREEQMMIERDRLKIQKDQADQQQQLMQMQIQKEKREQELIPLDYTLDKVGIKSPEEKAVVSPFFDAHSEDVKGVKYVTRSVGAKIWDKISQDPVFNKKLGEARIDSLDKQLQDLSDPMIVKKMDPQSIQVKYDSIIAERTKIANGLKEIDRELRAKFKESEADYWNPTTKGWERKNPMIEDTAGLTPKEVRLKEMELSAKGTDTKFQEKGVTQKGGHTVIFDPASGQNYVTSPQGERSIYDPAKHGKILSTTMSQTTINMPKNERDLPVGIQDKLKTSLELHSDWKMLRDSFKPEFMPGIPVKSVGEFKININKIFGNNLEAVDWWMRYFDARNLLLKERSGAAVMEPEFRRFEQGAVTANTNPLTAKKYLDRSVKKYGQHVDAFLESNRKNHPEAVSAFESAFGYAKDDSSVPPVKVGPIKTAEDYLKKWSQ